MLKMFTLDEKMNKMTSYFVDINIYQQRKLHFPNFLINTKQLVIFKPLRHWFEETIWFHVKASFASRRLSRLIRWHNNPGDIKKEFW